MKIWTCKIGEVVDTQVPNGGDWPMREAVSRAYRELIGEDPVFVFSGWDGTLTEVEREIVDHPQQEKPQWSKKTQ